MSGVPGRYDLFGWDYEAFNTLTDAEAAWHEMWARRTGGPLLGLACGTGRLLCRLARACFDVVGLDLSDAMLALARKNISMLPPEAGRRITLMRRDMSDFDLGGKFGLVFIADNSFREVGTRRGCFRVSGVSAGIWRPAEKSLSPNAASTPHSTPVPGKYRAGPRPALILRPVTSFRGKSRSPFPGIAAA